MDSQFGVTNFYVEQVLSNQIRKFRGCFSIDFLDDVFLRNGESVVVNLAHSSIPVGHFVAIKKEGNSLLYFDPLFLEFEDNDLEIFLKKHECNIFKNNIQVQSFESKKCGIFCIAFLLAMEYISFKEFLNFYDEINLSKNDDISDRIKNVIISHNKNNKV